MTHSIDVLQIHPHDNVCVAVRPLPAGTRVVCADVALIVPVDVRLGAKLAVRAMAAGERVIKYGEPVGTLTQDVPPGGYVHVHNLRSDRMPVEDAVSNAEASDDGQRGEPAS